MKWSQNSSGAPYRLALGIAALCAVASASAGHREQAKRMHDRLAGVPPTPAVLDAMEALVAGGDPVAAAEMALDHPAFYAVTVKNWATPWTNQEQTAFAPLNDYSATVIGMVRDGLDFRGLLSENIIYVGETSGLPAYSATDNDHYAALEASGEDLSDTAVLVQKTQTEVTGLSSGATAGVMTTRAAAKAYFYAGTNRAMLRFTLMNHLCRDLEQLKDNTRPADRIRQDVSRSPGGDSRIFINNCLACHSGMDPLAQAFAYYDYQYDRDSDPEGTQGHLVYSPGMVQPKYLQNSTTFEAGFVTPDDRWSNYWRSGPNAVLNWDAAGTGTGTGAKSLGEELANSGAFAQCQVTKVFRAVCLREPEDGADHAQIGNLVTSFGAHNYDLKPVFAETAAYCRGD
ncbi:MAG: hypothetical protein SV583_01680 [Pseudomonadota bacterium]|nr:hypothetical protein [Pseudomonadota bacterium]